MHSDVASNYNSVSAMIDNKCFTTEWIDLKSKELQYSDKNLIEKVIRAFSLLDMLARSGCPFYFKGGSCLMLLLQDTPHRLSIDIDIMCPPGTHIEDYLSEYSYNGFLNYQLIERKQAGIHIPKSHSKFFYKVVFKADMNKESYILLDVLYEDCHYQKVQDVEIKNSLIEVTGKPSFVKVPSIGDILADKLTAFAPETTGIPYYKKDKLATLEIIKQLYDVSRLFDKVDTLDVTKDAFSKIAPVELSYRNLPTDDLTVIFDDIRNTAMNISTRGLIDKEKFELLQKGIKSIGAFIYKQKYFIENAITDASKAAYLATCIQCGKASFERYSGDHSSLINLTIEAPLHTRLKRLKASNPEAFFYWAKTSEMINAKKQDKFR